MGMDTRKRAGKLLRFELPASPADRLEPGAQQRPEGLPSSLRVLVVDDNAAHRNILLRYLDYWGVRSSSAAGGREALKLLRDARRETDPFQLAIFDLSMPDMNGFELAEAVQRHPSLDDLRMILLTAFDQNEGARRALAKGFSAYLTKPVRHSRLLGTIRGVLADVVVQTGTEA
jgi:two-component system sensor histidine kinase/response regulator